MSDARGHEPLTSHSESTAKSIMAEPRPPRRVTPVELSRCVQADEWCPLPHPHACAGQWPQIHVMDGFRLVPHQQPTTRGVGRACPFYHPALRWIPLLAARIARFLPDVPDRGRPHDRH